MTWREFSLKKHGYSRQQKEKMYHTRMVSYYALVATGAVDSKKMSIEKFMPLSGEKTSNNDYQREAIREAQRLAIEEAKKKKNG